MPESTPGTEIDIPLAEMIETLRRHPAAARAEGFVSGFAIRSSPRATGLIGDEGVYKQVAYASFAFLRDTVWRPRTFWYLP